MKDRRTMSGRSAPKQDLREDPNPNTLELGPRMLLGLRCRGIRKIEGRALARPRLDGGQGYEARPPMG